MSFNVGDEMTLSAVTEQNGALVDDPGLTLTVEDPNGASVVYAVADMVHDGTGLYHKVIVATAAGLWRWTWTASPSFAGSDAGIFLIGVDLYEFVPWCTPTEVMASNMMSKVTSPDLVLLRRSCAAATEYLHSRTWRRFKGLREVELRPTCQHGTAQRMQALQTWMAWPQIAGAYVGRSSPDPAPVIDGVGWCGCSPFAQIELPDDVRIVTRVMINGDLFIDWRLDSGRRLTRVDEQTWPQFADVTKPDTEDGTFSVHVVVGQEPMEIAQMAAIELAAEFYLSLADPSQCRLPARVQNVVRQGVSFTKVDSVTLSKDGMLGLRLCDIFLSQWGKRRKRPLIASPDIPEMARRVGPGPVP